ncbi:MAG: site-specific integrase [Planctomycetes bacterium]|nr:site-specific integrase [Planctomycetota bacterium]
MDAITVSIFKRKGSNRSPNYQMQFRDPVSGRKIVKTTGQTRRREAERAAATWEAELNENGYQRAAKTTWQDFRERYEAEQLSGLAENTEKHVFTVFNQVEKIIGPRRLVDVTADQLSRFAAELRAAGRAESTIRSYLAHIGAALNWAVGIGLLREAPKIVHPKRAKGVKVMKGRPLATEEFERMIANIDSTFYPKPKPGEKPKRDWGKPTPDVMDQVVASWRFYLEGLWWSGLRLAESLQLYWDRDDKLAVDMTGRRPMLRIPAELEKGHKTRILPMAPEFAEFLERVPEAERRGRVFKPLGLRGLVMAVSVQWVSKMTGRIGEKACVAVGTRKVKDKETGKMVEVPKWASAQDLRRSFGERWSTRVMPQVLMELMRHENIETTMKYYVGRNAERTADALWAAFESLPVRTFVRTNTEVVQDENEETSTV